MIIPQDSKQNLDSIRSYQEELRQLLPSQKDTFLQVIEALACAERPASVVDLSLEPAFQRQYSSLHKALAAADRMRGSTHAIDEQWTRMLVSRLPKSETRSYDLFAIDVCSTAHEHANTLESRSYIRQNSTCGGYTSVGLQASVLAALPEKTTEEANWPLPINVMQVPPDKTATQIAREQLLLLARCPNPKNRVSAFVFDSAYTNLSSASDNQVTIARARSDRVGWQPYLSQQTEFTQRGRPKKYDDTKIYFSQDYVLGDKGGPDEQIERAGAYKGRDIVFLLSRWRGVHVEGQDDLVDVVKIEIFNAASPYEQLFKTPLLLIVGGKRRDELSSWELFECYQRRFDIEHLFRFSKRQLLFDCSQTPELGRQIVWWWIGIFAYWLLYLARMLAPDSNRRWIQKRECSRTASPGETKRVFGGRFFP